MAFTESDKVKIRKYLGLPATSEQMTPYLEGAIIAVQSRSDGGAKPDNSSELQLKAWLTDLDTIELKRKECVLNAMALAVTGEVEVDYARNFALADKHARQIVGYIADMLDITPFRDVFAPKPYSQASRF